MFCLDFVSRPRRLMLTMFVQMGIEAESRKKTITTQARNPHCSSRNQTEARASSR